MLENTRETCERPSVNERGEKDRETWREGWGPEPCNLVHLRLRFIMNKQ